MMRLHYTHHAGPGELFDELAFRRFIGKEVEVYVNQGVTKGVITGADVYRDGQRADITLDLPYDNDITVDGPWLLGDGSVPTRCQHRSGEG